MSALAQYHALAGGRTTGSDRAFDHGERQTIRRYLEAAGIHILPQDGSGLRASDGATCDALVVSTAVEDQVPDVAAARRLGIPIQHRSELLASYVKQKRTVAVTGTSGKSTVTAMIFEILRAAELQPSLLTGGNLVSLQTDGYLGNAWAGEGELLVIEADESDGSLVRYEPWAGVLLNLRLDHKPLPELAEIFHTFRRHTRGPFIVGEDENLRPFAGDAVVFGTGTRANLRAQLVKITSGGSSFQVEGVSFRLPVPGDHNVSNALAALATGRALGIDLTAMVPTLASFQGVTRRFQTVDEVAGITVIDDFAHNPDKIGATLRAARLLTHRTSDPEPDTGRSGRILAIFQPHGFGPTRFLREALVRVLLDSLAEGDRLWMPEIYYAGGTVDRDISSQDIVAGVASSGLKATFQPDRSALVEEVATASRPDDIILVMGARDPSLTDLCHAIVARLQAIHPTRG